MSNQFNNFAKYIPILLSVVVIGIGVVAVIVNDRLAGLGLIATGTAVFTSEVNALRNQPSTP